MEIIPYDYCGKTIRTTTDKAGMLWFLNVDVCRYLGLTNPSEAIRPLIKSEKLTLRNTEGQRGSGGARFFTLINKHGLYRLLLRTNSKKAEKFQYWVLYKLIPAAEKISRNTVNKLLPKTYKEALLELVVKVTKIEELEEQTRLLGPMKDAFKELVETEGSIILRVAAKELGIKPMTFIKLLEDRKLCFRTGPKKKEILVPYQYYIDHEWFTVKHLSVNGKMRTQTRVTAKGLAKLGVFFNLNKDT
ncbi:MAG: hypothetical protein BBJ57_07315 [Desulfobacterales bacterium PC51MH44]|nr:MAG: hypothetical protein BBJ57_07315 [Desulfobacterales bacterium PC51MH44]